MANLEKLSSPETSLQEELNKALADFSAEQMKLKREIESSNDLKARTIDEMQAYLDSGELKKRLEGYIQVNGSPATISSIEMATDKNSKKLQALKIKYKATMDNVTKELSSYLQIVGETNNSYIKFINNPETNKEVTSLELYDDGAKLIPENGYNGGKMFDINVVKLPNKGIDIRIVENARRTKEKLFEKIGKFTLKQDFTAETFKDATLENTKIETLKDTQLGNEIVAEGDGYYRAIFMREDGKYREIGKVYFTAKGELDTKLTQNSQEFKLLWVTMKITVNTTNNSFKIENIDELKKQILAQREILKAYIENSEFGDYTIFTWFNRPKGGKRTQTKLLGLKLIEDTYTFQRGEDKEKSLNFGFTDNNELVIKDIAGKTVDPLTIEIEDTKGKKELKDITKNAEKKQLVINKAENKLTTNQEKPELKDAPTLLAKDYLYSPDGEKLEYHTLQGKLIANVPATKTEENKWKLWELSENVQLEDLYKDIKRDMISKELETKMKNIDLLDNDIYGAFVALRTESRLDITPRKTVRVLDDEKNGIYKYYKVEQKKEGDEFVFEEDKDLYEEAEDLLQEVIDNAETLSKIENTKLVYKDKKERVEKTFTQFVGGSGLLPIATADKVKFLQETGKKKTPLIKTFVRGSKTEDIKSFPVTFDVNEKKISVSEKKQTINTQDYKTRLEEKWGELKLRFDDIE